MYEAIDNQAASVIDGSSPVLIIATGLLMSFMYLMHPSLQDQFEFAFLHLVNRYGMLSSTSQQIVRDIQACNRSTKRYKFVSPSQVWDCCYPDMGADVRLGIPYTV